MFQHHEHRRSYSLRLLIIILILALVFPGNAISPKEAEAEPISLSIIALYMGKGAVIGAVTASIKYLCEVVNEDRTFNKDQMCTIVTIGAVTGALTGGILHILRLDFMGDQFRFTGGRAINEYLYEVVSPILEPVCIDLYLATLLGATGILYLAYDVYHRYDELIEAFLPVVNEMNSEGAFDSVPSDADRLVVTFARLNLESINGGYRGIAGFSEEVKLGCSYIMDGSHPRINEIAYITIDFLIEQNGQMYAFDRSGGIVNPAKGLGNFAGGAILTGNYLLTCANKPNNVESFVNLGAHITAWNGNNEKIGEDIIGDVEDEKVRVSIKQTASSIDLAVFPSSLSFNATEGGGDPENQLIAITSNGNGTLNWTATDDMNWLSISLTSGTTPSNPTVSANINGLLAGTYRGSLTICGTGGNGSNRTIPVTLVVSSAQKRIFYPIADAYIGGPCGNCNYGSIGKLYVGGIPYEGGFFNPIRSLLKFNVSSLSSKPIGNATLRLYCDEDQGSSTSIFASSKAGTWSESSVNYYNTDLSWYSNSPSVSVNGTGWKEWNVTSIVQEWADGVHENNGFFMRPSTGSENYFGFSSREGTISPELVVQVCDGTPNLILSEPRPDNGASSPPFYAGQSIEWSVTVANIGAGCDPSYRFRYYLGQSPSDFSHEIESDSGGPLFGGESEVEREAYTFLSGDVGTRYLNVKIDDNGFSNSYGPFSVILPPVLSASPDSLSFEGDEGGATPPYQLLNISNTGGGSLNWSATEESNWLSVVPSAGTAASSPRIYIEMDGLVEGIYGATITISAPEAQGSPVSVSVSLIVNPALGMDTEGDGIPDQVELSTGTDPNDADTDDDGIPDGVEDANHNGIVDPGETDPRKYDSDGDGLLDGTELGITLSGIGPGTDLSFFIPDADPSTVSDPLSQDSDGDGIPDGREDKNRNGRFDTGENDPNIFTTTQKQPNWANGIGVAGARYGASVANAGDVNGDGYADVIIGADKYANGQEDEGAAFVYYGSANGLGATSQWMTESNRTGAMFGTSVASAGDVNGDGYADVVVGAPFYSNGQNSEGRAFVYYGSETGLSTTPVWTAESNQAFAYFGASVATAGDVNNDGYSDVAIGAFYYNNGQYAEGAVFVYYGSHTGLGTIPTVVESDQVGAELGRSVASAGDVNGDGFADVIAGAIYYDGEHTNEGRAYVFHGSPSGLQSTPAWTVESGQDGGLLGISAGSAGDVNGDEYSDVVLGIYTLSNGQMNEGGARLYYGSAEGLSPTPAWSIESDQNNAYMGVSVGTAGDMNDDGFADVFVLSQLYSGGQENEGAAFIYHGSPSGLSRVPIWVAQSDQANAGMISASSAGDVNGDGYSDLVIGSSAFDDTQVDEGRAFVYYGDDNPIDDLVWYVNGSISRSGTGASWNQAFKNLQEALAVAENGDEIWIAAGMYAPGPQRTDTFKLKPGVALYGGFDGTEISKEQRDWAVNDTILSGDIYNDDDGNTNQEENTYHVVTASDHTLLDGLLIIGGNANGDENQYGGGLYADDSRTTARNCGFFNNAARYGGGAYFGPGAVAEVSACVWANNHSYMGAGLQVNGSSINLSASDFHDNEAVFGAGAALRNGADAVISGCSFSSNKADNGGGLWVQLASPVIKNCIFRNNMPLGERTIGGGGGLCNETASPVIENCTFYANLAVENGGALLNSAGSHPIVRNSIFWGDAAGVSGNEIFNGNGHLQIGYSDIFGGLTGVAHGTGGTVTDLGGNIDPDPLFIGGEPFDCHLGPFSPCIDAGDPSSDWSQEPEPNGGRVNMGAYGGTMQAEPSLADGDQDGLPDLVETVNGTDPDDADTDDDGIPDGVEDNNHNGVVDSGETDPLNPDTDADGIQDGTELGYTLAQVGPDTDLSIFQPDFDPTTTTLPTRPDSDGDGYGDGREDKNADGNVDPGESDPNDQENFPQTSAAVHLKKGFNLVALPVDILSSPDLRDWLPMIGNNIEIDRVMAHDIVNDRIISFVPGGSANESHLLRGGEAVIVYAKQDKTIEIPVVTCSSTVLHEGINFAGVNCPPEGYTAYQLLSDLGNTTTSIQRFNAENGLFESTGFNKEGAIVGKNFSIVSGQGYLVHMKADSNGFMP